MQRAWSGWALEEVHHGYAIAGPKEVDSPLERHREQFVLWWIQHERGRSVELVDSAVEPDMRSSCSLKAASLEAIQRGRHGGSGPRRAAGGARAATDGAPPKGLRQSGNISALMVAPTLP